MGFMVGDGRGRSRPLLHPEICMTLQSQRDTLGPQTMSLGTALPPSGLPALVLVKLRKPKKSGNENWEGGGSCERQLPRNGAVCISPPPSLYFGAFFLLLLPRSLLHRGK